MKIDSKEYKTSFVVPDRPTVRQQLQYRSAIAGGASDIRLYEDHWSGVKVLATDWKSELIENPLSLNLDEVDDPTITQVIVWACNQVAAHIKKLETIPQKK